MAAQLFIEPTSCESHPFSTTFKSAQQSYVQKALHLIQRLVRIFPKSAACSLPLPHKANSDLI